MQFEIEKILVIKGQTYVLARQIEAGSWCLSQTPTLDGVPIQQWMDIPRAHTESGEPRADLFSFCLCDSNTVFKFSGGQRVDLQP